MFVTQLMVLFVNVGVSAQSGSSEADYAIPPDAVSCSDSTNSDEPEPKLLKTCAAFTAENVRKVSSYQYV